MMAQMKKTEYGYVCPTEDQIDRQLDNWLSLKQLAEAADKSKETLTNEETEKIVSDGKQRLYTQQWILKREKRNE